jgi:hypothetical protein
MAKKWNSNGRFDLTADAYFPAIRWAAGRRAALRT